MSSSQHARLSFVYAPPPPLLPAPRIGWTGTRDINAADQQVIWARCESVAQRWPDAIWVTGGARGADAYIAMSGARLGMYVHTVLPARRMRRPGTGVEFDGWMQVDPKWEQWCRSFEIMPDGTTYLMRDDVLVLRSEQVYAFPFTEQEHDLRSGTWYTVTQGRKQGKVDASHIYILHPRRADGLSGTS
jgi:hypothetical protein